MSHEVRVLERNSVSLQVSQRCSAAKKQASELRQAAAAASRQSSEHIAGSEAAAGKASRVRPHVPATNVVRQVVVLQSGLWGKEAHLPVCNGPVIPGLSWPAAGGGHAAAASLGIRQDR